MTLVELSFIAIAFIGVFGVIGATVVSVVGCLVFWLVFLALRWSPWLDVFFFVLFSWCYGSLCVCHVVVFLVFLMLRWSPWLGLLVIFGFLGATVACVFGFFAYFWLSWCCGGLRG